MKDIIDILRQQLVLCARLFELVKAQKKELITVNAVAASQLSREMETVMASISAVEKRKNMKLSALREDTLAQCLASQPDGPEKSFAIQLLTKQEVLLQEIKDANGNNLQYLDRNSKFIDYSINVMTQTSAGATYGTPEGYGGMPVQGVKMFEAGV